MRASKLLAAMDEKDDPFWRVSVLREVLAILATTQVAVEELARESSTGTERAIQKILDNETEGRT